MSALDACVNQPVSVIEGFRPERYISTMRYSADTPFWSENL